MLRATGRFDEDLLLSCRRALDSWSTRRSCLCRPASSTSKTLPDASGRSRLQTG